MDDLFLLSGYLGVFAIILAVGGFIADYIFPHIPIIENCVLEDHRLPGRVHR